MSQPNGSTTRARMLACPQSEQADLAPPKSLTGLAKEFWNRHATALSKADMLSPQDVDSFCLLCNIWALLDVAQKAAQADPKKMRQFLDLTKQYQSLAKPFCLLPTDRKKWSVSFKDTLDAHADKEEFDF